jgi:hypothetical protein
MPSWENVDLAFNLALEYIGHIPMTKSQSEHLASLMQNLGHLLDEMEGTKKE